MRSGWSARKSSFASSKEEPHKKHGKMLEKPKKIVAKILVKSINANIKGLINPLTLPSKRSRHRCKDTKSYKKKEKNNTKNYT